MILVGEHINSFNSPFKFNGKEYDEETGNYYYSARYYDPKLSIFISVDPLADKYPGISPYTYCSNNPINLIDPTGMEGEEPCGGGKENALQKINAFSQDGNSKTVWNNISKDDFIKDLTNRVNDPSTVNQADSPLCGVALPVKALAEKDPEMYVDMALSLYQTGTYTTPNGKAISANPDLYNSGTTASMSPADFVVLSSVKNSFGVGNYKPDGAQVFGITRMRQLDKIFTSFGFQNITGNYSDWQSGISSGNIVALQINMNGLYKKKLGLNLLPNHYIQANSFTPVSGTNNFTLDYWSWGQNNPLGSTLTQTAKHFDRLVFNYGIYKK